MMNYREIDIFGVYVAPFAPLALIAWLACLPLFRLSSRIGLSRWLWHTSLFNFALYAIVVFTMVLVAGAI